MRQILSVPAALVFFFGVLFTSSEWVARVTLPCVYICWLIFASWIGKKNQKVSFATSVELIRVFLPVAVYAACLWFIPLSLFDGLAEMMGRGDFPLIDEFARGCRVLLSLFVTHLVYLCLARSTDRRRLAENATLLLVLIGVVTGIIWSTSMARYRDTRDGSMLEAKILRAETLNLKGRSLPPKLGAAGSARKGDFLCVFTVEFTYNGQSRREQVWPGYFVRDQITADKLAAANPAGSTRNLWHWDSPSGESLSLHYVTPTGCGDPNWDKILEGTDSQ